VHYHINLSIRVPTRIWQTPVVQCSCQIVKYGKTFMALDITLPSYCSFSCHH